MNRCETCKHWQKAPGLVGAFTGQCKTRLRQKLEFYCDKERAEVNEIETPADFGCTLHEQKDGEK